MTQPPASAERSRVWVVGSADRYDQILRTLQAQSVRATGGQVDDVLQASTSGDCVVCAGLPPGETVLLADQLLDKGVSIVIDTCATRALNLALGRSWNGLACVQLEPARDGQPVDRLVSRLRDVTASLGALALLSPVLLIVAILIKRSSPGPLLYATSVVGRNATTFRWRKLRTMRVGTVADDQRRRAQYRELVAKGTLAGVSGSTKIVDESRVTGVGRFLRRHSLDELPQLWNVLRGEMSLVGPRPCLPYEYELQQPWQRLRFRVTPGLTGPWQAYGRSRVSVDEMALIDFCYSRQRTFWIDLRIIVRTLKVVVDGEGGK